MRSPALRVGVLVLAGITLLVGAVLFFSGNQIRHARTYETYFRDSVQGLDVGAAVKYRGVAIGAVTFIGLVAAEYGADYPALAQGPDGRSVLVRFQVDTARAGDVLTPANIDSAGLRARVAPQGLTGLSYVEIDFADPARGLPTAVAWTPRYPTIPSATSTLSLVQDGATALLGKLQQVDIVGLANGLQGVVATLREQLRDDGLHRALDEATTTLQALRTALTAADVPGLAADLRQTLATARNLAGGRDTQALLRAATTAADRLAQLSTRLPGLVTTLDTVARRADAGSADAEAALVPILRDARTATAALREASEALRRDPGQVVLQGPPPRSRFDGARP